MLHGSVYQMTRITSSFGQSVCKYVRYNPMMLQGSPYLPTSRTVAYVREFRRKRVAMITGWAGRLANAFTPLSGGAQHFLFRSRGFTKI